jgi:hypothetical protein
MESDVSLPRSQKRTTYPFLGPDYSNQRPPIPFLNISFKFILPSITRFFKQSLSIRDPYAVVFCSIRATCPVQFAFIRSTECYPLTSTNHEAPFCTFFFQSPAISSQLVPNFSLSTFSQTPSAYVLHARCETKFHTHTKRQAKL